MKKKVLMAAIFVFGSLVLITYANHRLSNADDNNNKDYIFDTDNDGTDIDKDVEDSIDHEENDLLNDPNNANNPGSTSRPAGQTNNSNRLSTSNGTPNGGVSNTPSTPSYPDSSNNQSGNNGTENPSDPNNGNEPPVVGNPDDLLHGDTTFNLSQHPGENLTMGPDKVIRGTVINKPEENGISGYYVTLQLIAPARYSQSVLDQRRIVINGAVYDKNTSTISGHFNERPYINVHLLLPNCNIECREQLFRFTVDWGTGHITNYNVFVDVTKQIKID